ncbi:MAG: hypothetical protein GC136_03500 [Alphaproteobacteria bacterium]|nr:hypothetical protein [Alphaproteobacteria bacterium]
MPLLRAIGYFFEWVWFSLIRPVWYMLRDAMQWCAKKAPGFYYSFWLHITLFVLLVGIPVSCPKKMPQQTVITVELLPVKDKTNIKPKPQPPEEPKPSPTPEPPKEAENKAAPEPKPKKKPEPPKPKIPKKATPQEKPKPKDAPKPKQEKEKEKDKKKDEGEENSFDKVLKSVEALKAKAKQPITEYDENLALSISEIDAIRQQIARCWSIPAGARDAMDMQVPLYIKLLQDGTVVEVNILEKARYSSDNFYRAAADAAVRAIKACSPLKGLPPEKYSNWKEIEMNFDPRDMLY